tara:strand:- start:1797 stop:2645 length:849 start_codon:yes stop_codon:yes gene_type:complete
MAKVLHTFTIKRVTEIEEEKTETVKDEKGEEKIRTYKETVSKEIPVEIKINQPSRRQMQEADMEFSVEMSRCIRSGILTKAMLLNKYSDTGGLISDSDAKSMVSTADELRDLQAELTILNLKPEAERTEKENEKIKDLTSTILAKRKTLMEKETSYITLFNHTADIKAQNRAILWYILNLTFYKDETVSTEFLPLFAGKSFEQREAVMFDYEDSENEIYQKCYSKLASIVSHWFFTSNIDTEEFDRIIREIDGTTEPEQPEESGEESGGLDSSGEFDSSEEK